MHVQCFCTVHLVCSTLTIHQAFFFFFCQFVLCCLFFVLNIYYLYVHIQLHRPNNFFLYIKARMRVLCFPLYIWFVQPLLFIRLFFFFPSLVCFVFFCFLSFLLNIYYLYAHIQLYRPNKILQYFHNYLTICTIHRPLFFFFFFFFLFAGLFCAFCFLSFLLNIYYLCVHIQLHRLNKFL